MFREAFHLTVLSVMKSFGFSQHGCSTKTGIPGGVMDITWIILRCNVIIVQQQQCVVGLLAVARNLSQAEPEERSENWSHPAINKVSDILTMDEPVFLAKKWIQRPSWNTVDEIGDGECLLRAITRRPFNNPEKPLPSSSTNHSTSSGTPRSLSR